MTPEIYQWGAWALIAAALVTFPALLLRPAPYGRHERENYGPMLSARVGWIVMELPSPLCFALVFASGDHATEPVPLGFAALYLVHYLHRTFVFPLRMRIDGKRNPLVTVLTATAFNVVNGSLNGFAVSHLHDYAGWLADPRLWVGVALFVGGFAANLRSDATLRALRAPGETGYRIPYGGAFRWVSCPNYLGEIIEWAGWAIATWSLAGFSFAIFTFANLAPRAHHHHLWYREKFPEYPSERRALLPGLW